jgi:hypothetical protein
MKKISIKIKAEDLRKKLNIKDGEKGERGDDGKTPIAGVDFPLPKDGKSIKGDDGYTPIKGVDYFDGEDGEDGSPDTRLQIVEKINSGKKNDLKIKIEQIEGYKKLATELKSNIDRAISILDQRTQFLINKQNSNASGTITAVTASAPLSSSGGTTPNISIAQATISTDGYLSSTDWNTFNNKQEKYWSRSGTNLSPFNAGDHITLGGADGSALIDIRQTTTLIQGVRIEGATGDSLAFNSYVTGEAQLRFIFQNDGKQLWGDGTNAADVNWYRTSAGTLRSNGNLILDGLTASQILGTNGSKQLVSLDTATYPSLTELTYVKGVTSAIQTQLDARVPTTRTLTINGSTQDLSANRTWTITTTGTSNRISVSGGTGLTPTIDIDAAYVGQTSITTLGTIATGTWSATTIATTKGGTGLTSYTQGDIIYASASNTLVVLAKNTSATRYLSNTGSSNNPAWAQVDLSNGVTGTLPAANITKANLAGTSNQISLSASGTGVLVGSTNITLSLPQDIATTSTPQFARLGLGVAADATGVLYGVKNGIANTKTDGFILANETAATSGVKLQYSPRIRLKGSAWKSNATASSQTEEWAIDILTVDGTSQSNSSLAFWFSHNGGTFTSPFSIANGNFIEPGTSIASVTGPLSAILITDTTYAAYNLLSTYNDKDYFNLQTASGSGGLQSKYNGTNVSTTNATFTTIKSYALNEGDIVILEATIVGRDGSTTDNCGYVIMGTFKRESAGSAAQVGTTTVIHSSEESAGTDVQFTTSGNNVLVQVKGINPNSYTWACVLKSVSETVGGIA